MTGGKTKGKLAKVGRIVSKEKIGMEWVYHRVTLKGGIQTLVPCMFSGASRSFSVVSFQILPLLPLGFPHQSPVPLSQAVPLATFHGPYAASQPCPVLLKLCHSLSSLQSWWRLGVGGAVYGQGAEELGLWSVSLLLQNLTQTHCCTQGRENWQWHLRNAAPAFTNWCFMFPEHPTLCRGCAKPLRISEEGQACRLTQEWPLWFKSSLIWRIKRCKSLFMLWGLEN